MNAWRVAWRVRLIALAASPAAVVLTAIVYVLEGEAEFTLNLGEAAFYVLDAAYFTAEALFVGMLLEAMFVEDGPPAPRDSLRPSLGALRFAAAMAPVGLAATLLQLGLRELLIDWLTAKVTANPNAEPGLSYLWLEAVTKDPAIQWLLGGLVAPFIAVRTLRLEQLATRPSTRPSLGLVAVVVEAVVLAVLLYRGTGAFVDGYLADLAWIGFITWYAIAVLTLTLIAAAIGLMLRRTA